MRYLFCYYFLLGLMANTVVAQKNIPSQFIITQKHTNKELLVSANGETGKEQEVFNQQSKSNNKIWSDIAVGKNVSLGITSEGVLSVFSSADNNRIGLEHYKDFRFIDVVSTDQANLFCMLTIQGELRCLFINGNTDSDLIYLHEKNKDIRVSQISIGTPTSEENISDSNYFICYIGHQRKAICKGQFYIPEDKRLITNIPNDLPFIQQIQAGAMHVYAFDYDGQLHTWGRWEKGSDKKVETFLSYNAHTELVPQHLQVLLNGYHDIVCLAKPTTFS